MSADPAPPPRLFGVALVFELGLALVAVLLGAVLGPDPLAATRVDPAGLRDGVVATVPLLVVFWVTWKWPVGPFRSVRERVETLLVPGLRSCSLAELALVSIAAGLGEEFLFRGVIQGALDGAVGTTAAIVIAGLVFGLAHAVTLSYAVFATLMGVYLGWLWVHAGNLVAPITCHALYDFVALWVFTRATPRPAPPDGAGRPGGPPRDRTR